MAQRLRDVGLSEDIRQMILHAHATSDTVMLQLHEVFRTVVVTDLVPQNDELTVMCSDVDDSSTIILHLPYASGSTADAEIVHYIEGGD